jgi:hypothetical protein
MMKHAVLFFACLSFTTGQAQSLNEDILGEWRLEFVETMNGMETPGMDYVLNIRETSIEYNTDVNQCSAPLTTLDEMLIEYNRAACTKVCCNGTRDPLGGKLNYSGTYVLEDDLLRITNTVTFVFTRNELR